MKRLAVFLILLAFHLPAPAQAQGNPYVVIVHPDNPTEEITKKKLSKLLLKEISKWEGNGNEAVHPVDLGSGSQVREAFSKAVHGRSVTSIKNFWQRQIFSGKSVPPPEVENDAAVVTFVKSRPGGIGYVSPRARLDGVKVLKIAN